MRLPRVVSLEEQARPQPRADSALAGGADRAQAVFLVANHADELVTCSCLAWLGPGKFGLYSTINGAADTGSA